MRIMDSREQAFQGKTMRLIKVYGSIEEWMRQHGNVKTLCVIILSYLRMKVYF